MKKKLLWLGLIVVTIIVIVVFSSSNSTSIPTLSTNEVKDILTEQVVMPLQNKLREKGIDDIEIEIKNLEFVYESEFGREYTYDLRINSDSIDNYKDLATNEKHAKELFKLMQKMDIVYQDYYKIKTKFEVDNRIYKLTYKPSTPVFEVHADVNTYYFDSHSPDFRILGLNKKTSYTYWFDTEEYEYYEGPDTSHSSIDRDKYNTKDDVVSGNKTNPGYNYDSYDDGYNSVVEDGDYDYDRYDSDDDYRDGVDDALDELNENY